jgi:hypothetical protein
MVRIGAPNNRYTREKGLILGCLKRKKCKILFGCDTMGKRIGRIEPIQTDFFLPKSKKSGCFTSVTM